jgi:hypothetical protein
MRYTARTTDGFFFKEGEEKQAVRKFRCKGSHGDCIRVELRVRIDFDASFCIKTAYVMNPTAEALADAAKTLREGDKR